MKHLIISARGRIFRILDEANDRTTEVTDAIAAEAQTLTDNGDFPILFEGSITTRKAERENGYRLRWDGTELVRTIIPVYVPNEVTNFQIKQALNVTPTDRAQVDAFVAGSGDQNIIDGWEHASTFKRDNALFIGAVAYLEWTQEKVDNLLILAATFK